MNFTKYETRKAYHWRDYIRGGRYRRHCDFLKSWITEDNILDVGAGDGLVTFMIGATGIDNELSAVKIAESIGVNVALGSAYNLHFSDDSFDAVTMIDVIEHLNTPEVALAEARRVAPLLYISTPERQPNKPIRDKFHVQEWTRGELVAFLAENGYDLVGDIHYSRHGDTLYSKYKRR